jgi:methylglutaconyl-CoA hydratase
MTPDSPLLIDHEPHGVVRVTLHREAVLNAFDEDLIARITVAFTRLGERDDVRLIVLAASGRTFCAGADIGWMQRAAANSAEENLADARHFAQMMHAVATCPKPVIARIQGGAFGGGVGLACAADFAIASRRAVFAVSEARFGIIPSVIGPYLVNAVGRRQAKRLALTCERLDADQALAIGLVTQVVDDDAALDAAVQACVQLLLANGPGAQAEIKALFGRLGSAEVDTDVRELTAQTISRVRSTPEAREGFAAFMEKRPAPWVPNASAG